MISVVSLKFAQMMALNTSSENYVKSTGSAVEHYSLGLHYVATAGEHWTSKVSTPDILTPSAIRKSLSLLVSNRSILLVLPASTVLRTMLRQVQAASIKPHLPKFEEKYWLFCQEMRRGQDDHQQKELELQCYLDEQAASEGDYSQIDEREFVMNEDQNDLI